MKLFKKIISFLIPLLAITSFVIADDSLGGTISRLPAFTQSSADTIEPRVANSNLDLGSGDFTTTGTITGDFEVEGLVDIWTAPLAFSSSTASITQADTDTDGYLSFIDWDLFNDKITESTTISDSDRIDFTLTTYDITADIKTDSINDTFIDWGIGVNQVNSADIPDHGTHSIKDMLNHIISRGIAESITVTDEGDLGISWGTGELYDNLTDSIIVTEAGSASTTDNSITYLKWSSGTTIATSTSISSGDEILVAIISSQNGDILNIRETSLMDTSVANTRRGLRDIHPSEIISGLSVSEDEDVTNDLDVVMDAGVYYLSAIEKYNVGSAIYSRTTPMVKHYLTGGAWDSATSTEIDTANYNNGTNLVDLPTGKWLKSVFIYENSKIQWIYPTAYYDTEAQALLASLPTTPSGLAISPKTTALVYKADDTDFSGATWQDIRSINGSVTFSGVTDHGSLSGLGDDDHTIYTLADGTRAFTGSQSFGGFDITNVGSLGVTGTRLTKGWFTDLEITNAIAGSITGNSATVTSFTPASGSLTLSGADALTLITTAETSVTLPTSGTLVNSAVATLSSLASIGTITTGTWNATPLTASYYGAASIDGDDVNSNIAGRSLTLTGASPDTLDIDAEIYTRSIGTYVTDPVVESASDLFWFMDDITITYVYCKTDTGTVTLNIEDGSDNNILSAELVCDAGGQTSCASGCDVNTINTSYDNITGKTETIDYDASAVASDPTELTLYVGYQVDD